MCKIEANEQFLKDHGIEKWGKFNDPPEPYYESDIQSLFHWIATYGFGETEYRQVYLGDGGLTSVHLIAYHTVMFMLALDYSYNKGEGSTWTPRVWKVGCQHDFYEKSTIRGDHWCTCKICGFKYYYNSGD